MRSVSINTLLPTFCSYTAHIGVHCWWRIAIRLYMSCIVFVLLPTVCCLSFIKAVAKAHADALYLIFTIYAEAAFAFVRCRGRLTQLTY